MKNKKIDDDYSKIVETKSGLFALSPAIYSTMNAACHQYATTILQAVKISVPEDQLKDLSLIIKPFSAKLTAIYQQFYEPHIQNILAVRHPATKQFASIKQHRALMSGIVSLATDDQASKKAILDMAKLLTNGPNANDPLTIATTQMVEEYYATISSDFYSEFAQKINSYCAKMQSNHRVSFLKSIVREFTLEYLLQRLNSFAIWPHFLLEYHERNKVLSSAQDVDKALKDDLGKELASSCLGKTYGWFLKFGINWGTKKLTAADNELLGKVKNKCYPLLKDFTESFTKAIINYLSGIDKESKLDEAICDDLRHLFKEKGELNHIITDLPFLKAEKCHWMNKTEFSKVTSSDKKKINCINFFACKKNTPSKGNIDHSLNNSNRKI